MGANEWRAENEWPLARTRYTPWYLHADGSLEAQMPVEAQGSLDYVYDPHDPVPTLGGNIMRTELRGAFVLRSLTGGMSAPAAAPTTRSTSTPAPRSN